MLDHVSLPVSDLERSAKFYNEVLATLNLTRTLNRESAVGFGPENRAPIFWLIAKDMSNAATPGVGLHISFEARDRGSVDRFHKTGLELGAKDAGAPGLRPEYTAPFYGAFLLDLDGFKVEAVCRVHQ